MTITRPAVLDELDTLRRYIATHRWQFAKTMRSMPHWYTVREWDDCPEFEALVLFIREYGYQATFKGRAYTYLDIDGFTYWTMGAPLDQTIIINRRPATPAYHSALKTGIVQNTPPVPYIEEAGNVAMQWDMAKGRLPAEYDECDLLYAEMPWLTGFQAFDERANIFGHRAYTVLAHAVRRILTRGLPTVLIVGQRESLPTPDQVIPTTLNGAKAQARVYNTRLRDVEPPDAPALLAYLSTRYDRIGDPFCGYGNSGRMFAEAGKTFTMSDYNPSCIGYIAMNIVGWVHGLDGETEAP